jgi:hypothetical protein
LKSSFFCFKHQPNNIMASRDSATDDTNGKLSLVDRSVVSLLSKEEADQTASRRSISSNIHISPSVERLHRLHGTSLLWCASQLLQLPSTLYATACSIFHRYCHQVSLSDMNVWAVAMACTVLAGKIEEDPRPLRQVVLIYSRIYRRRRLILIADDSGETIKELLSGSSTNSDGDAITSGHLIAASEHASIWSMAEKEARLRMVKPLSPLGPVYDIWYETVVEMEQHCLRQLGFSLYWIPDSHPHSFLLYFCQVLFPKTTTKDDIKSATAAASSTSSSSSLHQRAWNYCNDSCRLDLCMRFAPEVIACTCIWLAVQDCWQHQNDVPSDNASVLTVNMDLPSCSTSLQQPWWHVLIGTDCDAQISTIANAILSLQQLQDGGDSTNTDVTSQRAAHCFVPSLSGKAFNDPESYLWSITD